MTEGTTGGPKARSFFPSAFQLLRKQKSTSVFSLGLLDSSRISEFKEGIGKHHT
jgi:hypothetical protein